MEDISGVIPVIDSYLDTGLLGATPKVRMTVTYAQSIDGRISAGRGLRTKLSGPHSHTMTHYLRTKHDAILVGRGTAEADDPKLNCRYPGSTSQPQPIILDSSFSWQISRSNAIVQTAMHGTGKAPWILCKRYVQDERIKLLDEIGGRVVQLDDLSWQSILEYLGSQGIDSLMVEGGAKVIDSALQSALATNVIVTIAPAFLGHSGVDVAPARRVDLEKGHWVQIGLDVVLLAKPSGSDVLHVK